MFPHGIGMQMHIEITADKIRCFRKTVSCQYIDPVRLKAVIKPLRHWSSTADDQVQTAAQYSGALAVR